jgi:hypothetical protein
MKKFLQASFFTLLACASLIACSSRSSAIDASMSFDKTMPFQINDPIVVTVSFLAPAPGEAVDTAYLKDLNPFDTSKYELYAYICSTCTTQASGPYFVGGGRDADPAKYPLSTSFEVISPTMSADRLTATTPVKAVYDSSTRILKANFTFKVLKSLPNREFVSAGFFAIPVGVSPKEFNKAIGISTVTTLVSTN